jgi:hypothetical protein
MRHTIAHASGRLGALAAAWIAAFAPVLAQSGASSAAPSPTAGNDPFARRGWHLELAAQGGIETWNYNANHEEMVGSYAGLTYGLGKGVVLTAGSPLYRVWQRGVDGYMLGLTWGARGRLYRRGGVSLFWEVEVGLSESDTIVPPRGTRFNFLLFGSGGATIQLRDRVHLLAAMKWIHVSNNSLAGRDRNPDIEAVGPKIGVVVGF